MKKYGKCENCGQLFTRKEISICGCGGNFLLIYTRQDILDEQALDQELLAALERDFHKENKDG